eukprot:scaffold16167_cov115-Isochrysis_galbana.AAC.2
MMEDIQRFLAPLSLAPQVTPKAPQPARTVTPPVKKVPPARSGTTSQFAPKAVPDTAPSPNNNFNFKAPSTVVRSTADPQGDLSSSFAHPLPPGSREARKDKDGCLRSWVELVDGQPDQVASLYRVSQYYDTILQVLNSNASIGSGRE